MKKIKRFFRRLSRKILRVGVSHPAGFFGPAWAGAEAIILRNGRVFARPAVDYCMAGKEDFRGKWRRISARGWAEYCSEAASIQKSRFAFRKLDLSNFQ